MKIAFYILVLILLLGCTSKNFQSYSKAKKVFELNDRKGSQSLVFGWKPYLNKDGITAEDIMFECTKNISPEPKTEQMAIFQLISCMQSQGFFVSIDEEIIIDDRL